MANRRLKSALAKSALAGVGISIALIVTSSIQASAAVSPSTATAGYAAAIPATDGEFAAWTNVIPVACTPQAPQGAIESMVQVRGTMASNGGGAIPEAETGDISYVCTNGTPDVDAEINDGAQQRSLHVSAGDVLRFVLKFSSSGPGRELVRVQDKSSRVSVTLKRELPFQATTMFAGAEPGLAGNIPKFNVMHFWQVSLDGQPLSAVTGLVSENMINTKGNIMVRASGLTRNGRGFSTTFVRTG
jgi:hypothetical protein